MELWFLLVPLPLPYMGTPGCSTYVCISLHPLALLLVYLKKTYFLVVSALLGLEINGYGFLESLLQFFGCCASFYTFNAFGMQQKCQRGTNF